MKPTEKKNITIKLTTREANWLYNRLETIRMAAEPRAGAPGIVSAQLRQDAFMAESLQDRIDSET